MRFSSARNVAIRLLLSSIFLHMFTNAAPFQNNTTELAMEKRCDVNPAPGGTNKFVVYQYDYVQIVAGGPSGTSFTDAFWGIAPQERWDELCSGLVNDHGLPSHPVHEGFDAPFNSGQTTFTVPGLGVCYQGNQIWTKQCDGSFNVASPDGGMANCVSDVEDNIGICAYVVGDSGVSGSLNKWYSCTGNICLPGQYGP